MRLIDADALYENYCDLYEGSVDEGEIDRMSYMINSTPTACNDNGWISCSKDLPKERIDVLVWHSDQDMCCVAWYNSVTKIWYSNDFEIADSKYVVAWQPLPEPYEE